MTDSEARPGDRPGGLAAWAPRAVPGPGIELTPGQELAIALRHLDDVGWCENMTGHITVQQGDEFLVNPWGLWWGEVCTSDLLTIDADGTVIEGAWDVTPAVHLHTELHRARADARVVVHNHPPYASALAAIGELPDLVHQNSSILVDELVLVTDYDGEVDQPTIGAELADRIGDASVALLVSHGVIVTAPTIEEAVYKSVLFERTCMLHWLVRAMDRAPVPIAPTHQKQLKASLIERAAPVYWHGVVRALVRDEPDVLE
jgi:ribulose-5-phosphate 4-epimerase/fuculose-1-phosphate aldolase